MLQIKFTFLPANETPYLHLSSVSDTTVSNPVLNLGDTPDSSFTTIFLVLFIFLQTVFSPRFFLFPVFLKEARFSALNVQTSNTKILSYHLALSQSSNLIAMCSPTSCSCSPSLTFWYLLNIASPCLLLITFSLPLRRAGASGTCSAPWWGGSLTVAAASARLRWCWSCPFRR